MTYTTKKMLFVFYVLVTMFITGWIFHSAGQFVGWTSGVTLFGVSFMVLWDLITA